jgi:hypothetical protein
VIVTTGPELSPYRPRLIANQTRSTVDAAMWIRQRDGMLVAAAIVCLSVAGCSGSSGNASSAGSAVKAGDATAAGRAGAAVAGRAGAAAASPPRALPPLARPPLADRSIVYTADLTVRAGDVSAAVDKAATIATGAGGYVFSSDTGVSPSGDDARSAMIVLKIPPRSFPTVLRSLAALGTTLGRNQHAEDVTDEVVDVAARLLAQQASVARVRTLLAQARTIGEVVAVESELTKREADLESLQGRQRALDAQVSLSTITLRLVSPAVATTRASETRGFLAGLGAGWHNFVEALQASLTVLGALLPFAVLLGVLVLVVGVPLRRLLTGRRRAARPATDVMP